MSSFHIRPRFQQIVALDPDAVRDRIVDSIGGNDGRFEVKCFPGFICIRIHEKDQHFWSPRLHLNLEAIEGGKTEIRGTYGPNANVWSLFLFCYIIFSFLGVIAGIVGGTQRMIGGTAWGFWLMGGAAAILVGLYLAAQIGQKLGAQQTFLLHQAYESATEQDIAIH